MRDSGCVSTTTSVGASQNSATAWRTFLQAHWPALVAADFFTTEVWTARGLVTYSTAFVIELHTRRVRVLGSTPNPDGAFVVQAVRGLLGEIDAVLREGRPAVRSGSELDLGDGSGAQHGRRSRSGRRRRRRNATRISNASCARSKRNARTESCRCESGICVDLFVSSWPTIISSATTRGLVIR